MIDPHAADYCPTCGQPREREQNPERFGLTVRGNFMFYQGRRERVTHGMANFAKLFIERGSATHEYIILRLFPEADSNIRQVYANRFRKHLQSLTGGAVKLYNHHSWGYELIDAREERAAA